MRLAAALFISIAATAALPACFTSAGTQECRVDGDCDGLTCTRVGECASQTRSIRVEWTMRGLTTDQASACTGIQDLEILVTDPTTGDDHAVRPVPCSVGSFLFDKLPLGYTDVTVSVYGAAGDLLDTERGAVDGAGVVRLSLLR